VRGSCELPEEAAEGEIHYLDFHELVTHETEIRQWLSAEPNMGKCRLVAKMLFEKGVHVTERTAQSYLERLQRADNPTPGSRENQVRL